MSNLSETLNECLDLGDLLSSKLNKILTCMDGEHFSGDEKELVIQQFPVHYSPSLAMRSEIPYGWDRTAPKSPSSTADHFAKVWLYANSHLPPHLPPFKVYMPTWPLLCLAAQYSEMAYIQPTAPSEHETHVPANWRRGTKAMVLKTLPRDDMNTIVFAIRGSQTFMDCAVNYRSAPKSPENFLDDAGNLCHDGCLMVARSMLKPVTERLRQLLSEDPSRCHRYSLMITGHSAGGAIAQLLYAHMTSTIKSIHSELKDIAGFFKRVHCVTFGAPPVSLLPLRKPGVSIDRYGREFESEECRKSLFYAFVNEGDPVARADKAVVASLLKLYASPAPGKGISDSLCEATGMASAIDLVAPGTSAKITKWKQRTKHNQGNTFGVPNSLMFTPSWPIPPGALSLAGRVVVLRQRMGASANRDDVEAFVLADEQLRDRVFGDPMMHQMTLYRRRVQTLATRAVTGG